MKSGDLLEGEKLLCWLLKISPEDYFEVLCLKDRYRKYELKGRKISVPVPLLKWIQTLIHKEIGLLLLNDFVAFETDLRKYAHSRFHGFMPRKSIISAVNPHAFSSYFFKLDLENAFGSVRKDFLVKICFPVFLRILWSKNVFEESRFFSKTTSDRFHISARKCWNNPRIIVDSGTGNIRGEFNKAFLKYGLDRHLTYLVYEFTVALIDLIVHEDSLPKGAPTSPDFFVYATYADGLIKRIHVALKEHGTKSPRITIYADDIIISADRPILKKTQEAVFSAVEKSQIFSVNSQKIRYFKIKRCSPKMLGLSLRMQSERNGIHMITLRRENQSRVRAILRNACKNPDNYQLFSLAMGITGHLCRIFPPKLLPAKLKRPLADFLRLTGAKPYYLECIPIPPSST